MRLVRLMAFALGLFVVSTPVQAGPAVSWPPTPGTSWHIQFGGVLDTSGDRAVYDIDMEDTDPSTVAALHTGGKKVICYVNAGAWENWRPDKADFPRKLRGRPLDGWPGERWLDIRKIDRLMPVLEARMDKCVTKGFDGIEFDNVDGYQNNTGFPLRKRHQIAFNERLAAEAVERGLEPGLKNALGIVDALVDDFAFAINEQCFQYDECDRLQPFIDANKAVFHIEYRGTLAEICAAAPAGFSTILANRNLNGPTQDCP